MQSSNAASERNQLLGFATTPPDRPITTHRTLSVFKARRVKRDLVTRYCEGRLSEAAVTTAFKFFPELRSA